MKREAVTRRTLARHEAGHLLAIALLDEPGDLHWRRLTGYDIAHVTLRPEGAPRWDDPAARDAMIARRTVIALAGGAAERSAMPTPAHAAAALTTIRAWTGSVDLDLAHEWLTLQRYDGRQTAIVEDMTRLFAELSAFFARPTQQRAIAALTTRIEALLAAADREDRRWLCVPAAGLLTGLALDPPPVFALHATASTDVGRHAP